MAELEDTLRETGVSAMGSTSPSKVQPQDIDRAFSAADRVDPGSSMPEAGLVPFHNKVAETPLERAQRRPWWLRSRADRQHLLRDRIDRALFDEGKTAALRALGLLKLAEGLAGSAPIPSPTSVKPPKSSTKISPTYDTRTDKPPGYNLTHGVQTMSNGADVNDSYGAFGRRLQGSPV